MVHHRVIKVMCHGEGQHQDQGLQYITYVCWLQQPSPTNNTNTHKQMVLQYLYWIYSKNRFTETLTAEVSIFYVNIDNRKHRWYGQLITCTHSYMCLHHKNTNIKMKRCSMVPLFFMLFVMWENWIFSWMKKNEIPLKININYANNHLKTK